MALPEAPEAQAPDATAAGPPDAVHRDPTTAHASAEAGAPAGVGFAGLAAESGSWFGAFGAQGVLLSWLVVVRLQASAEAMGLVQSASLIPQLLLVAFGGALADRRDPRRVLVAVHLLTILPIAALMTAIASDTLTLWAVIAFATAMSAIGAFSMPARDALLSNVAGADMLRAVTSITAVQFAAQALGSLLAGGAGWVGPTAAFGVLGAVLAAGALVVVFIPAFPQPRRDARSGSTLASIREGLGYVVRTPRLRIPVGLFMAVGAFFVGPFMVVFPLIVRDVYGGDIASFSVVMMMFPLGTIAGSLFIRAVGVRRKGRAALIALALGGLALVLAGAGYPFPVMVGATLAWGLCGAAFINCSRTILQEAAPAAQRARVLSVYQLGFSAMAPFGAWASGQIYADLGGLLTVTLFGGAMVVLVAGLALFTSALRMD